MKINFMTGHPMKLAGKTLYQEKEIGMTDERKAYLTNNPSGTLDKIVVAKEALFRLFQKFNVFLSYIHGTKRREEAIARLER
jgi:hypothetical protein